MTGVELVDRVIATWSRNANLTGNGMKYFGWNTQGVPTVSEYSPYIRAPFTALFIHFLNRPDEIRSSTF